MSATYKAQRLNRALLFD